MAGEEFLALEPLPLAGLRFGIAQGFPLENLDETVAAAFAAAHRAAGRRPACGIDRRTDAAVRRDAAGQCLWRHRAAGGVCHPSRADQAARRRYRSEYPRRASSAAARCRRRTTSRHAVCARASGAGDGPAARRARRADHADGRRSSRRRSPTWPIRRHFCREQYDAAAQYLDRQFLRSLRHLAAAAGEAAGRADAAWRATARSRRCCALPPASRSCLLGHDPEKWKPVFQKIMLH